MKKIGDGSTWQKDDKSVSIAIDLHSVYMENRIETMRK